MLSENLRIALTSILANKLRAALTTLGIMIGVASVIAVVSLVVIFVIALGTRRSWAGRSEMDRIAQPIDTQVQPTARPMVFRPVQPPGG